MAHRMGYRSAIQWLVDNDDTQWVNDIHGSPSVTACLVADLFGKDVDVVTRDLVRAIKKSRG